MVRFLICMLILGCMGTLFSYGNDVKPLQMKVGEEYEIRTRKTSLRRNADKENSMLWKNVERCHYVFSILEASREKGFLLEMCRKQYGNLLLVKKPEDPRWSVAWACNSNVVSSARKDLLDMERIPVVDSVFRVRLSPDLRVVEVDGGGLDKEADKEACCEKMQQLFSSGKKAAYRVADTVIKGEYPHGISFWGDWQTKIYHVVEEVQEEVRFSRLQPEPFSAILEGDRDERVEWERTNTVVRGEVKGKDSVIRISCVKNFPVYEKNVYRVPIRNGQFEFRLSLSTPFPYFYLEDRHNIFLEPGDELLVKMDSVKAGKVEFSGLGAGNNRYYHEEGSRWGYSLYRIDRNLCAKDYYAKLEEKADYFHPLPEIV